MVISERSFLFPGARGLLGSLCDFLPKTSILHTPISRLFFRNNQISGEVHKRGIESAVTLTFPQINSMLNVNFDSAIYQRSIIGFEGCFE